MMLPRIIVGIKLGGAYKHPFILTKCWLYLLPRIHSCEPALPFITEKKKYPKGQASVLTDRLYCTISVQKGQIVDHLLPCDMTGKLG